MSVNDLKNIKFEIDNKNGYRIEQVDKFVADIVKILEKNYSEIDSYRNNEESIKKVLLNAQKIADLTIKESQEKADFIIKDAKKQADLIVSKIAQRREEDILHLNKIKSEVNDFKALLLKLYRAHIESISSIPDYSSNLDDIDIYSNKNENVAKEIKDEAAEPLKNSDIDISLEDDKEFDFQHLSAEDDSVSFDFTKLDFEE